ncbi:hypothetical protein P879_11182 [Paragonimus westermani]|uniref:Uncharacterized protein n=1 Tax=Paragonimus westermani TaxID=34504 RepID=A0A8T0DDA1_9TREM|nr:hypothetical protein P879_11182 [Paragonimus westermani]
MSTCWSACVNRPTMKSYWKLPVFQLWTWNSKMEHLQLTRLFRNGSNCSTTCGTRNRTLA